MRTVLFTVLGILAVGCSGGSDGASPPAGNDGGTDASDPPPPQVPPTAKSGDCGLEKPAFCETFETPAPGGKGGDLDETKWAFNRWGHFTTVLFARPTAKSSPAGVVYKTPPPTFCGAAMLGIDAPNDVRECDGLGIGGMSKQLNEVLNDDGGFGLNEMRIRQPFDFTGRSGTVVFDLDAKKNDGFDGHGWWTEMWITEDPSPIPYHGAPTVEAYPRNGIGFQIIPVGCGFDNGKNEVGRVFISKDYKVVRDDNQGGDCFSVKDGSLNRFKLVISKDKAEFYATDAGKADGMRLVTTFDNLNLNFTRGYIHFQHAQYNANKADASPSQTYRWDNIGFDGPSYAPLRTYEVADELTNVTIDGVVEGKKIGYDLAGGPVNVKVTGVDLTNASRARFAFNIPGAAGDTLKYRFNGKAWHTFTVPPGFTTDQLRSFVDVVPLDELVAGTNTLDVDGPKLTWYPYIGNMELLVDTK